MSGYDGAPVGGMVSDPAGGSGPCIPLPQYRATVIYTCPECDGDLQHEGVDGYWCPACRRSWSFTEVGVYEDGDRPDAL